MAVALPPELAAALDERLDAADSRALAAATEDLSRRYREGAAGAPVARSREDVLAYAAFRLPATFAAAAAAMAEVRAVRPAWEPRTVLDLGAGTGAASWAAASTWPSLERVTAVEAAPAMAELGRALGAAGPPALASAEWRLCDLADGVPAEPHDLVVLAYVAGELRAEARARVVAGAWRAAAAVLLVVEPGTPRGYAAVVEARAALLREGARTAGPCPHDEPCPMAGGDWCHFAVRLPRSGAHRAAKRAALGHEDEKYSWAALARDATGRAEARVLRHPQIRGGHVQLELCTPAGLRSAVVSKRHRELYRRARKAGWGDAFPDPAAADAAPPSDLEAGPPTVRGA